MASEVMLVRYDAYIAEVSGGLLDEAALARATGLHPDLLKRLYGLGLFDTAEAAHGGPLFEPAVVLRLRRMMRLRQDLGLSWSALALVADLLERIDALEARVRTLEEERRG